MIRSLPRPARLSPGLLRLFVGLAVLWAAWTGAAWADPNFPRLTGRVVDQAGLLDAGKEAEIAAKLAALEKKTSIQLVVVTLTSLQGYDIADYGYRLGRHWGIGQKGKNNGVLLIVAPNDRRVRIEVGYGLEGTLTDLQSHLIIENDIKPRFRARDYAGGIEKGVDDLVQVLSGEELTVDKAPEGGEGFDFGSLLIVGLILGFWVLAFLGHGFGRRRSPFWIIPGGGGWGSGRGGGGFSGGGGSFGGGGASGSW